MGYYLGESNKGLPIEWFLGVVVVRDLAVVALCVLVIREIYRPSLDPLRVAGEDDPTGGVLDRAPDVFRLDGFRRRAKRLSVG